MDLFQELSGQPAAPTQTQQNNPTGTGNGWLADLYNFSKNFKGNPQQQVQNLMKAGGISQADYNQAVQQANMVYSMLTGGRK